MTIQVRVVHCRRESCDLYIGRAMPRFGLQASPLGNPDRRGDALSAYRRHFASRPDLQRYACEQYQKHQERKPGAPFVLGCWCKTPEKPNTPCHGDVIKEYLEQREE